MILCDVFIIYKDETQTLTITVCGLATYCNIKCTNDIILKGANSNGLPKIFLDLIKFDRITGIEDIPYGNVHFEQGDLY